MIGKLGVNKRRSNSASVSGVPIMACMSIQVMQFVVCSRKQFQDDKVISTDKKGHNAFTQQHNSSETPAHIVKDEIYGNL